MIPAFSFVVPACNVAPWAAAMIESLKAQTINNFEALIISEESNDNTVSVIRTAIGDDTRFQVIELPRSGSASISRNYGIKHAAGNYLVFVDGDDWIEPDTLQRLDQLVKKNEWPDVLLIDWVLHINRSNWAESVHVERCHPRSMKPGVSYSGIEALTQALAWDFHTGSPVYIIRAEFLRQNSLYQIPGRRIQDDEWTPRVLFFAQSVVYTDFACYHYRKRDNSVTTDSNPKTLEAFTENFHSYLDFTEKRDMPYKLRRLWARWMCRIDFVYFSPSFCRRFPQITRIEQFQKLTGESQDFQRLCRTYTLAGRSKRMLIPLFRLARYPSLFSAAEFLYGMIYWPIIYHLWGNLRKQLLKRK